MKALFCALLVLAGLPVRAANVVPDPFPPARMTSLYIEMDDNGKATTLQVAGDAVIYKVSAGNQVLDSITVHPSGDDGPELGDRSRHGRP